MESETPWCGNLIPMAKPRMIFHPNYSKGYCLAGVQASLNTTQPKPITLPSPETQEKLDREIFGDEYVDNKKQQQDHQPQEQVG